MGHCVLDEGAEDEAEADAQVHVDGLDEAVGVGQRGAGPHHQGGHGQHRGDPLVAKETRVVNVAWV